MVTHTAGWKSGWTPPITLQVPHKRTRTSYSSKGRHQIETTFKLSRNVNLCAVNINTKLSTHSFFRMNHTAETDRWAELQLKVGDLGVGRQWSVFSALLWSKKRGGGGGGRLWTACQRRRNTHWLVYMSSRRKYGHTEQLNSAAAHTPHPQISFILSDWGAFTECWTARKFLSFKMPKTLWPLKVKHKNENTFISGSLR